MRGISPVQEGCIQRGLPEGGDTYLGKREKVLEQNKGHGHGWETRHSIPRLGEKKQHSMAEEEGDFKEATGD